MVFPFVIIRFFIHIFDMITVVHALKQELL